MNPTILLAILLALSVAGNAWQYNQHSEDMVKIGTTEQLARDTKAAADACSAGVASLETDGKKRHADLMARIAAQSGQVADLKGASIAALNARPADTADLCKSLELYLRAEITKERGR